MGSSTAPADRPRAEAAIGGLCSEVGRSDPRFLWCDSPAAALWAIRDLGERDPLWASLGDPLWASLGDPLWASLRDPLWASLRASLGDPLWASLRASLRDPLWASLGGQHDVGWIALYTYCRDVLGVELDPRASHQLDLWAGIAGSAGWWWPYRDVCLISERPALCRMAEQGGRWVLSADDGPALRFRDGYAVWAVEGVRVPQQVVESPQTLDPAAILAEPNVEVRRVMIERFGAGRLMREAGGRVISEDDAGRLWQLTVPREEALAMVEVLNSTPESDGGHRTYWLRVPPGIRAARGAVAWTFGRTARNYRPVRET